MAGAEFYFGNDDLGKRLYLFGRNGGNAILWNPSTSQFEDTAISTTGAVNVELFNSAAVVDGVPGQNLQEGKAYYAYAYRPGGGAPTFYFNNTGFTNPVWHYTMNDGAHPAGIPQLTDPSGNKCILAGMCYVVNDPVIGLTVRSVPSGYPPASPSSPRFLTSPSPWNDSPAQPLGITTDQAGGAIIGSTLQEINPQYHRIISCVWAWRGVGAKITGYGWVDAAGGTIFAQIRSRDLSRPGGGYTTQAVMEGTSQSANYRFPIVGHLDRALDDGVFEFSFWGSCSPGNGSYNITHTLNGWV